MGSKANVQDSESESACAYTEGELSELDSEDLGFLQQVIE